MQGLDFPLPSTREEAEAMRPRMSHIRYTIAHLVSYVMTLGLTFGPPIAAIVIVIAEHRPGHVLHPGWSMLLALAILNYMNGVGDACWYPYVTNPPIRYVIVVGWFGVPYNEKDRAAAMDMIEYLLEEEGAL